MKLNFYWFKRVVVYICIYLCFDRILGLYPVDCEIGGYSKALNRIEPQKMKIRESWGALLQIIELIFYGWHFQPSSKIQIIFFTLKAFLCRL